MTTNDYTIRVNKLDRRRKSGDVVVETINYTSVTEDYMLAKLRELRNTQYPEPKYTLEMFETYVARVNLMTGREYQERWDTPICCSPASETHWSM